MLLEAAILVYWPNISKFVGEHCVDVSQPTDNRRGGKQSSKLLQTILTYEHALI